MAVENRLENIVIVLSRPSEPGNVGALCRSMMNCGLCELRLAAPLEMNDEPLRSRAVHAAGIWEKARFFERLEDALSDCSLVIGTTRRRGERRGVTLSAREAARFLAERGRSAGKTALVFGNERTGLTNAELQLCDIASHIPAHDMFPSLNLSHSVQIYGYELYLAFNENAPSPAEAARKGAWEPLPRAEIDVLAASLCDSLALLGFYTRAGRAAHENLFRGICSRAGVTQKEARLLRALFAKAARIGRR
jgi:tRNA/rRNA methyltransferase/tRNA (cytidine32/uridine32-2'-O)-methyltransferase